MKLQGKTIECPTIEYMYDQYGGLFEKLNILIIDDQLLEQVKSCLVQLEWCDLYYELINKEHGGGLSRKRQESEYERFYENVIEQIINLKSYIQCSEKLVLNIPYKQSDTHKILKELLHDDKEALDLIHNFYPFIHKRSNQRELHNKRMTNIFNMLKNPNRYLKAAKWTYIEPVKNKVFTFSNVFNGQALTLKDETGNTYSKFTKINITDIHNKITLDEGIDYKLHRGGSIVILPPLLQKCHDIKVIISTDRIKFKRISL